MTIDNRRGADGLTLSDRFRREAAEIRKRLAPTKSDLEFAEALEKSAKDFDEQAAKAAKAGER